MVNAVVFLGPTLARLDAAAVLDLPRPAGPGPGFCAAPVHGELPVAISLTGNPGAASTLPLRTRIGNPADPRRRPVMTAVTTLTLRADRDAGEASMVLLWRDPSQVASGGGLYQVAPAGMFQPSHDAPWNLANDFSLWRAIVRERKWVVVEEAQHVQAVPGPRRELGADTFG